jgi:GT2 family glycosyltransferase
VFVFLNDDVEADAPGWLDELVCLAVRRDTGAVGARLWYPDGRLQHGGIILGVGGAAGHAHKYLPRGRPGYMGRAALPQQLSAVTGACLAVRRAVFEKVDGMDESFPVAFNDVDLCLRIRALGYRNVWTPYAQLTHHESASRGSDLHGDARRRYEADRARLMARWGEALRTDPAYNPNLTLDREDFTLAWPPRGRQPR